MVSVWITPKTILETVDKLVIGRKFFISAISRPAFFNNGVTQPFFILAGNRPALNDRLAMLDMAVANSV